MKNLVCTFFLRVWHHFQVLGFLLMSWWPELGVFDSGDVQHVQCRRASRARNHWVRRIASTSKENHARERARAHSIILHLLWAVEMPLVSEQASARLPFSVASLRQGRALSPFTMTNNQKKSRGWATEAVIVSHPPHEDGDADTAWNRSHLLLTDSRMAVSHEFAVKVTSDARLKTTPQAREIISPGK